MKIKWCGVFKNVSAGKSYKDYYVYVDWFGGRTVKECKQSIQRFVKEMAKHGMVLNDQELIEVED